MTQILAGQRVFSSDINGATPLLGLVTVNQNVTSSTAFADAAGLAVTLDPNTTYGWDCYLAYAANETADIKVAVAAPSGATGHWGCLGVISSSTGGAGSMVAARFNGYGDSNFTTLGGSNSGGSQLLALPRGVVTTGASGGLLQVRFAQNVSNAAADVIVAGAWLRALKIQ